MMIDLKFLKAWGAYNVGELARFAEDVAKTLIAKGVAIEHSVESAVLGSLTSKGASTNQTNQTNQQSQVNASASATTTQSDVPKTSGKSN
jgi:hypothetical protein